MTAELLGHFEHESPEWHAARAAGIGGSEIAAILGLSRYQSRYSLWMFKKGLIPDQPVNAAMTVGTYVEPAIVAWLSDKHGRPIETKLGTWRNVKRPYQVANLDGRMGSDLVECKFQVYDSEWGPDGSDEIPPYYLAQCRWYLDVFGLDTARVGVLFGGAGRFAEYVVHPDSADTALMRSVAEEFMESLANDERPDIDAHGATYEALRQTAEGVGSGDIEVSGDVADQFLTARADLKTAETAAQFATNRVMGLLNDCDAKRATFDGKPIAYRTSRSGGTPYLQASPRSKDVA